MENINDFLDFYQARHLNEKMDDEYSHRVELRDGKGNFVGEVGDYDDLEWVVNSSADDMEASQITMPGSAMYARTFMQANRRVFLVHIHLYRKDKMVKQWTGRVDRAVRTKEGPQSTVKVELISDKGWLSYILCFSAPFSSLEVQAPKRSLKVEPAIFGMKQFLIDNLIRIQSDAGWGQMAYMSEYHKRPQDWATVQDLMYPLMVVPTPRGEDTTPIAALTVAMTAASDMMDEVCKDYNLLPTVRFHVPGRDPAPPKVRMTRPGVVIDIIDKEKSRANGERADIWGQFTEGISVFFRGLFGRYDSPPVVTTDTAEDLKDFFGRGSNEPWVIFRDSREHWNRVEVASYAPTATTSIAGGKSHDFLNKGIMLIANSAIQWAFSLIGLGFAGNLITGELDNILFAYQRADDPELREFLGPFAFFEEFTGQGTTAYSMDTAQALRSARWSALGYKTASFSGDAASVPPFRPFEDFDILDPCGWEDVDEDRIIPDRIKQISVRENRSEGITFEFRLGELERPEEPWAVQQRRNARFKEGLNAAFMSD